MSLTPRQEAWLSVLIGACYEKENALRERKDNFGILVHDDLPALRFQRAEVRYWRAL